MVPGGRGWVPITTAVMPVYLSLGHAWIRSYGCCNMTKDLLGIIPGIIREHGATRNEFIITSFGGL